MCNLYSITAAQSAIVALTRAMTDKTGNLPPLPGIFPDYLAPIVRNVPDGRELTMARWGMPSPAFALAGKKADPGVTNVRNTASPHWRRWLGMEHRCVVPFNSFAEYGKTEGRSLGNIWFALSPERPLACFAGIWTRWDSVRKVRDGMTTDDLFAFLTTEPNAVVRQYHPKAMPVILTSEDEIETWMTAEGPEALKLQRPLGDGELVVVGKGGKADG